MWRLRKSQIPHTLIETCRRDCGVIWTPRGRDYQIANKNNSAARPWADSVLINLPPAHRGGRVIGTDVAYLAALCSTTGRDLSRRNGCGASGPRELLRAGPLGIHFILTSKMQTGDHGQPQRSGRVGHDGSQFG